MGSLLAGSGFGRGTRRVGAQEVQFPPVEQLPLDFFPRLQADGRRQGQGEAHVEPGGFVRATESPGPATDRRCSFSWIEPMFLVAYQELVYRLASCPARSFPSLRSFAPRLPTMVGNVDYLTLRQRLEQIEALLRESGVEREFVEQASAVRKAAASREPTAREQAKFQQRSRRALRCTTLRTLLQEDYRGFSRPAGRQPALAMVLPGRCAGPGAGAFQE